MTAAAYRLPASCNCILLFYYKLLLINTFLYKEFFKFKRLLLTFTVNFRLGLNTVDISHISCYCIDLESQLSSPETVVIIINIVSYNPIVKVRSRY